MKLEKFFQTRVGDGDDDDDDGDDGDGRISPEHPRPILHAPRDIISRKGKSLTPINDVLTMNDVLTIDAVFVPMSGQLSSLGDLWGPSGKRIR